MFGFVVFVIVLYFMVVICGIWFVVFVFVFRFVGMVEFV